MNRGAVEAQMLTRADCLALLAPGGQGRVAATMRAVPIIIPVVFTLLGDDIVFMVDEAVSRAVEGCVVAFQTDDVRSAAGARWEVHVTGVARIDSLSGIPPRFRLSSEIVTGWQASD